MYSNVARGFRKTAGFGSSLGKVLTKAKGAVSGGLSSVGKSLGKHKDFAINMGGMSLGMALPFAAHEHMTAKDGKSFGSRIKDDLKWTLPANVLFSALDKKLRLRKAFGGANISKYIKGLRLTGGKSPLVALNKAKGLRRFKWPIAGAAAGGYLNYDPENPLSSAAKGAAGGALLMSPKLFKRQAKHGVGHAFMDEMVDAPGYLMAPAAIMAGVKKYTRYKNKKTRAQQEAWLRQRVQRMRPAIGNAAYHTGAQGAEMAYGNPSKGAF